MSAKAFFDTNVLLYTLHEDEPGKRLITHELVARYRKYEAVISYQVLQEFCNACLRKFRPEPRAERVQGLLLGLLEQFEVVPWSAPLLPKALDVYYRYRFQWYDSLIVAAALEARCEILYTEDLQHGQVVESMAIINPFL